MKKIFILPIIISSLCISTQFAYAKENKYTDDDLYALAHIIMGEAEGGSYEMKIGVGSVVLNRVADYRFPNTIEEVIFQPGQYMPTWDGRYYLEPNDDCWKAAKELLEDGSQYDADVIWQGTVPQGEYVYMQIENMYFCG